MKIWVDADAAPRLMKEVIYKTSDRLEMPVTLVANQWQRTPPTPRITAVVVDDGFDAADDFIAERCQPGDIVITADILLAGRVVERGVAVITPRGDELDADNIAERVSVRNLMEEARSADVVRGGPPPFNDRDRQQFANTLDRVITAQKRVSGG